MGKKILIILGSPRKTGNSATLAHRLKRGAENRGAETDTVYLNGLHIKPCQGCEECSECYPDIPGYVRVS